MTNRFAICHFLLVSHWNRVSIFNRFRDIRPQNPCVRTHRHPFTRRKWFYVLSHAMYCIGQIISCDCRTTTVSKSRSCCRIRNTSIICDWLAYRTSGNRNFLSNVSLIKPPPHLVVVALSDDDVRLSVRLCLSQVAHIWDSWGNYGINWKRVIWLRLNFHRQQKMSFFTIFIFLSKIRVYHLEKNAVFKSFFCE